MKKLFPLILLVALIAFAYVYNGNRDRRLNSAVTSGAQMRKLLLPDLPVNDIRKIRIREGSSQLNLAIEDGQWRVKERDGYPASFDKIQRVLMALRELKIADKVVIGRTALAEAQLLAPDEGAADRVGLCVDLMNDKGDVLAGFIAGKSETSSGGASSGNWMGGPGERRMVRTANPAEKNTVWWVADGFAEWKADPKDWVDKSFVDVRKIKSVSVTAANAADSWNAARKSDDGAFELSDAKNGEELDTAKVGSLASLLANATYVDVLTKDKVTPDFMKDAVLVKVTTFEGFTYNLKVLEKKGKTETDNKTYLSFTVSANINKTRPPEKDEKPEDKKQKDDEFAAGVKQLEEKLAKEQRADGWVFEVSNYNVESVLKKRGDILREKKPAQPAPGATQSPAPSPLPPGAGVPTPPKPPVTVTTPPISIDSAKPMPSAPAGAPAVKAPTPGDGALKPANEKPAATPGPAPKPDDAKPVETKPAEAKPAEPKPAEPKP